MYLITGGTGNVGGEVARALREAGEPVRAVVRTEGSSAAAALKAAGVETVVGDLNDPETLKPALENVQGLFLLPGYQGATTFLADAAAAGVTRLVQLSGSSADGDPRNAVSRYMAEAERTAKASGLATTILRPSMFMTNTFEWREQLRAGDVIRAPFADVAAAVLDPADIGEVAALCLRSTGPEHAGQVYRLTGPQALRPADRVAILAEVLGRPLRFDPTPNDEAHAEMSATMPPEYVAAFFDFYVNGSLDESPVLPTVENLLNRPPHTFHQWAQSHAAELT